MDLGKISFHNSRASGVEIAQLGSGDFSHIGFFGPLGPNSAVEASAFQDVTMIVDEDGNPLDNTFGGTGYMTNNKIFPDISGVRISGLPAGPFDVQVAEVNVFDPQNLNIAPDFINRPSGTLMIRYLASGVSEVQTFNAKIWAYDAGGALTDEPPDVNCFAYEINASGLTFNSSLSGVWKSIDGQGNALLFANHSTANGYNASNEHLWVCGLCVQPQAVGVLDQFNYSFSVSFF